jgi:hypothetical protein
LAAVDLARSRLAQHHGSQPPGATMPDEEGFTQATNRRSRRKAKGGDDYIQCSKAGCNGRCPRSVVQQGLRGNGFVPAKCRVCDRRFKIVPGNAPAAAKQNAPATDNSNKVKSLEAKVKELEARIRKAVAPQPAAIEPKESEPQDEDLLLQRSLQKQIHDLKNMEPTLRDALCEGRGGYATVLASLESQLQLSVARRRQSKPLAQQKAAVEALLKRKQKVKDDAEAELQKLQQQRDELDTKMAEQQQKLDEAESCLTQAKADAAAIAEKTAAELRAEAQVAPDDGSITAATVLGYMQKLPTEIAEHPEGKHAMGQVMAFLDKLHNAAQSFRPPHAQEQPAPPAAPVSGTGAGAGDPTAAAADDKEAESMAVDEAAEDLFAAFAEAAIPPVAEGADDDAKEARRVSVAAAKARMASQPGTLSSLSKVRKVTKK